jgi:hypothetical protein
MAPSNEANEANEANAGSLGQSGWGGWSVLPDRVDLPFITQGRVAAQRLSLVQWNDEHWSSEWAAWLMLVDFTQVARLPYARPALRIATSTAKPGGNTGNGTCEVIMTSTTASAACVGTYQVRCVIASAAQRTIRLIAPSGRVVMDRDIVGGAGSSTMFVEELNLKITDGSTIFHVGDGFDVEVVAVDVAVRRQAGLNTGNGSCALASPNCVLPGAQIGTYQVRCTVASTHTFELRDPSTALVETQNTGTGTATFTKQLDFTLTEGTRKFGLGDSFDIVVSRLVWLDEPVMLRDGRWMDVNVRTNPSNVGNGRCVPDTVSPTRQDTQVGTYTVRCTAPPTGGNDGTFTLDDPSGTFVDTIALTGGSGSFSKQLYLTIFAGGVPFAIGDRFTIEVVTPASGGLFEERELRALIRLAEDERADALGEILAQADRFINYFTAAMSISPRTHPATCQLLHIGTLVGAYVSMHFKGLYQRRRPSQRAPALMPPIGVPGHPSYPSGHSTQAHLTTLCAREGLPNTVRNDLGPVLDALAGRIARNREIAGLHFASDSNGGEMLAQSAFDLLRSDALPMTRPQSIPPATFSPTKRRFDELVTAAQAEWP